MSDGVWRHALVDCCSILVYMHKPYHCDVLTINVGTLTCLISVGFAVYFYLEPSYSDCRSAEDNDSGEISTWDEAPPSSNKHGHLASLAWSFTKYIFFGAFVMILSHIRHHNHLRRLMSESNGNMNAVS